MKYLKITLLSILTGMLLVNAGGGLGCMPVAKNPYGLSDPYESDPTDATLNNNDFARASAIQLSQDKATIGALLTINDVDVYDLGGVNGGDKLVVDLTIPDRVLLNAAVAVFDEVGRLFYLSGEVTQTAPSPLTDVKFPAFAPHFEFVARQKTAKLFLAVASLAEPTGTAAGDYAGYTGGPYSIDVAIQRGGPVPQPAKQTVALIFDDSIVDYPPQEAFGNWIDNPPLAFSGLNGLVLDPAWWRPIVTVQAAMMGNQFNPAHWNLFLTFVNAAQQQGGAGQAQLQANQLFGLLAAELPVAVQLATQNPANFPAANNVNAVAQWFGGSGLQYLSLYTLFLGPGIVPQGQQGGNAVPGLNAWNNILPPSYPLLRDPAYSDFTGVAETIRTYLQDAYKGLNVEFLLVGVDDIPQNVSQTNLYLASDATGVGLLGLASSLDMTNLVQTDLAVIFAGEVGYVNAILLAGVSPNAMLTSDEVIRYVGNTTAHELGHLLGLVHTNSAGDIMNTFATGRNDLLGQFSNAPLHSQTFPIGYQDSGLLLLLELGMK